MLSIIICSIDDSKFNATAAMYVRLLPKTTYELIRIPNARSLAEGYNRGMKQSRGEHLLLSHDDMEILSSDFEQRFFAHLNRCDILGLAGTSRVVGPAWINAGPPHLFGQTARPRPDGVPGYTVAVYNSTNRFFDHLQALDGVFLGMHRRVMDQLQFDEIVFDGFHVYDTDFTYAAYLAGLNLGVAADIQNLHASGGKYDDKWKVYARRFTTKYAGRLTKAVPREFSWNRVHVADKQGIVEVQTPTTWEAV